MHRRAFLATAATAGLATAASAAEPVRRQGRSQLRLSLAAYSFRQLLDLRQPNRAMTLDGFIDYAAALPFQAVELTAYYFPQTGERYLAGLKGRATRLGLDVSGTAVGNNFCVTDPARLRTEIDMVKRWVEYTSRLGGKTVRVFAGTVAAGDTEEAARRRCVEAMQEACEHAGQYGVYLALENHGGITGTPDQMLAILQAVRSDWFGVNLDTGNFHTADPYADLARIAPYALVVQLKTEVQRTGQRPEEADLERLVQILRAVNYRGYVALEYEAAEDARTAVPRYARRLRELFGG